MEIFCRHLPDQIPEKRLKKSFDEILQDVTYECRKLSRGCATLTFCDARKGQTLLDRYGPQRLPLLMFGKFILLSRSRNSPDQFLLRNLEETESKRRQRGPKSVITDISAPQLETSFNIKSLSCGLWDYDENGAVFINYFRRNATGHVVFGRSCLKISLIATSWPYSTQHVECDYSILSAPIYLGDSVAPTVTFSLESAPRLFGTSIMATLQTMTIKDRRPSKARISSLDTDHRILAATCFVYQLTLMQSTDLQRIQALKRERHIPKLFPWVTPTIQPRQPYRDIMTSFLSSLDRQPLPYGMKYQLQMLVWNGVLSPTKVTELFTQAHQIVRRSGLERGVQVFQALAKKVQYAGPEVNRSEFDTVMLAKVISELEAAARRGGSIRLELGEFNPNNVYVHKATVTPVGTYLYGPYWESKNRVLRRYASYTDYFLRVEFSEETGDPMRFDQNASLDEIFQGRFKSVLKDGFRIAGRHFEFLGFSHSSLRSHTCWFMAPFTLDNGEVLDARNIITQLGDFSVIRSPARCAARIGQAFSETLTSIEIPRRIIEISEDVKRNGRVFSDGVGTLSRSLTHRIWEEHTPYAKLKPTVFQIRLAGAKGMVSLDSTLNGDALMLRRSMVKFEASDLWNIEICGAGSRPLPLFLNRPLIKILEDLGVPSSAFVDLQKEETDRLRAITQSPLLAANFFEKSNVVKSTKLPWLIRALDRLGIHYSDDDFVRQAIELAVVVRLHELKYRSRICVEQGITLYGIMDETGFLREGEVYCVYCPTTGETQGKQVLVRNKVVITRSPALHPGDVQLVNAVDVPKDSPLNHLRNCIVFSQHGARDLPSQLSGGDLDGDLYNIIYDERLKLKRLAAPADYDRAPEFLLDRPVAKGDIIDFFITFMQQDQLGRIAMLHQAIADQKPLGTFDSDCVLLAEMHSTAVDFSKTGHPADISHLPKCSPLRPDFMAPGPRVKVEEDVSLINLSSQEDAADDDDRPRYRYYKSTKVLGELYRAIDEHDFLEELQASTKTWNPDAPNVLAKLWAYVRLEVVGFQWSHHLSTARDIKEIYEDNLTDLMYKYSATPWSSTLTELEVFIGNIMGKEHRQSKRQREASTTMREEYDRLVQFIIAQILDKESGGEESLERAVACLAVAVDEYKQEQYLYPPGSRRRGNTTKLRSFRWIAAAVCLQEVEKLQKLDGY